jgi:hypothetical protein
MVEENLNNNAENTPLPTCPCGHNKNHPMVQAKGDYTPFGYFLVTFGISYRPLKVRYLCLKCNTYFDETTEQQILNEFS